MCCFHRPELLLLSILCISFHPVRSDRNRLPMNRSLFDELSAILSEMSLIRQDLHAHPETAMKEVRTSALVAAKLREWNIKGTERVGKWGVVGTLVGTGSSHRSIGLRADMDALELVEQNEVPYVSTQAGLMHACGHDGHTAMLLGAAKYLAEHRHTFSSTVHFVFQPAEEKNGGAIAMMDHGWFDRFPMDQISGLHNTPDLRRGQFAIRAGPIMAAADTWFVT